MTLQWNTDGGTGTLWRRSFRFSADGVLIDLTGLTWQFVIRTSVIDKTSPALISVTQTPNAQGSITVDLPTSVVTVTLTGVATALLTKGDRPLALWSNPTDPSGRILWVEGIFNAIPVATP